MSSSSFRSGANGDDDDLYGDLDTSTSALEKKEAMDQRYRAERESDTLRTELAQLQHANKQLAEANQVLEANISTLFATAQNEIRRKDKEIQRLRDALDAHERTGRDRAPAPLPPSHKMHAQPQPQVQPHTNRDSSGSRSDRDSYRPSSKSPSYSRHASSERHR